eukprot:g2553.t1
MAKENSQTEEWGHYTTLGVDPEASEDEIKKAFRKMVGKHKNINSPERATTQFKKLQEAYEVLKDRSRRTKYNLKIDYYGKLRRRRENRRRREVMREHNFRDVPSKNETARAEEKVPTTKRRGKWTPDKGSVWYKYAAKSRQRPSSTYTSMGSAAFGAAAAFDGYKKYVNEKQRLSQEFDAFADNVTKIQEKWRKMHADVKKQFKKRRPSTPLSETDSVTSPPPPPPPPASSPPESSSPKQTFEETKRRVFDTPEVLRHDKGTRKPRRVMHSDAETLKDSPATIKMNEHIRLLERLKKDQKNIIDTQLQLTWKRQQFWKKYKLSEGAQEQQKASLRRRFEEQSAKMEAMKRRFELRRRFSTARRSTNYYSS